VKTAHDGSRRSIASLTSVAPSSGCNGVRLAIISKICWKLADSPLMQLARLAPRAQQEGAILVQRI
jgi:hypothetical protein